MRHHARDGVGLEDLSWLASLLGTGLCTLIRERKGGFANQCEHDLGLITCERGSTFSVDFYGNDDRTFMNVLVYALPIAHLGRW